MAEEPLLNVEDVVGPLGHVLAVERLEDLGVFAEGAANGVLRRIVPGADHIVELLPQTPIVQHLQVGGEDGAVFVAELLGDADAVAVDFGGGGVDGASEARKLFLDGVSSDESPRDAEAFVIQD